MLRRFLSLTVLMGSTVVSHAQHPTWGLKAGVSLASLIGSGVTGANLHYKFGFYGGLTTNFEFKHKLSVQPEVLFSTKGTRDIRPYAGASVNEEKVLHYLDMPIVAHIKIRNWVFESGPQASFLVTAKSVSTTTTSPVMSATKDITALTNRVDTGYIVGLGYELPYGPGVGLRYNGGFMETRNINAQGNARNSAFQLYATYLFGQNSRCPVRSVRYSN